MSDCDELIMKLFHFRRCFKTKPSPSQAENDIARLKEYVNLHIKAQFDKDPEITVREVKKWLITGNQPVDLLTIKRNTLDHFSSFKS